MTQQNASSATLSPQQVVIELVNSLGPTAVSYLSGAKDQFISSRWARGVGTPKDEEDDQLKHMRVALDAYTQLESVDGPVVARQLFIGQTIAVKGEAEKISIITALRKNKFDEVKAFVEAYVETDGCMIGY